jgi:hypothetical protein
MRPDFSLRVSAAVAFAFLAACSATPSPLDADPSVGDATAPLDDAGLDATADVGGDAGVKMDPPPEGGLAGDILGTLGGSCGEVRAELAKTSPSLKIDTLTFVTGEAYNKASLSAGGQKLFDQPNAGGSSGESETMSYEVLRYCEGALLLKTETEVTYGPAPDGGANSITDILMEIDGKKVGVSVTRAYKPKNQGAQTDAEVTALLEKKLKGINASTARVTQADKWVKQVLHVFAATQASVEAIERVLPGIDATVRSDTVVLVTKTIGGGFIYCDPDPALGQECP